MTSTAAISPPAQPGSTSNGFIAGATAFAVWGSFPLYFHVFHSISPLQVIAHRIVWSCGLVLVWMAARGQLGGVRAAFADRGVVWRLCLSATLITVNWIVYVWGVNNGHVVETSLGYFIGPLVNVLLGVVLLSERLNRAQWTAVTLAVLGVAYLTVAGGRLPWIALVLAVSFASYGLIRKLVNVEALPGLATETLVLLPFAGIYLLWCESIGSGALGHSSAEIDALLIASGPVTAVPLYLYAYATRVLPYSTVGVLQYIAPSLQFACGVFAFHEPIDRTRLIAFALIWAALLIYGGEGLVRSQRRQRAFA